MRNSRASTALTIALGMSLATVFLSGVSMAAIPDVAGKTGELQVKLKERCALSSPDELTKRMVVKGNPKYDLSKESFSVYVPKEAGPEGKYGLIVVLPPQLSAKPPQAWEPVLDKFHLIWIGTDNCGDGRDPLERAGLVLDAAYNAQTTWTIDQGRVFLLDCANNAPVSAMQLYYPDVFDGAIHCNVLDWFSAIQDSEQPKGFKWEAKLKKPAPEILDQAKTRRFFIIDKLEDHFGKSNQANDIVKFGYEKNEFKNVKVLATRTEIKNKYAAQPADWFEAGITYLDVKPQSPAVALAKGEAAAEAQPPAADARQAASTAPARGRDMPKAATTAPPPAVKDAKSTAAAAAPPPPPPPPPVAETPEEKAQHALNAVKSYIAAERYDIARARLQKIVTDYPDTPAAKDAKALLKDIQNK